jgi:hypothetical protein
VSKFYGRFCVGEVKASFVVAFSPVLSGFSIVTDCPMLVRATKCRTFLGFVFYFRKNNLSQPDLFYFRHFCSFLSTFLSLLFSEFLFLLFFCFYLIFFHPFFSFFCYLYFPFFILCYFFPFFLSKLLYCVHVCARVLLLFISLSFFNKISSCPSSSLIKSVFLLSFVNNV